MKKVITAIEILILVAVIVLGVFFVKLIRSPQYALKETLSDFKEEGYSGLREHLTSDAAEKLDRIVALSENKIIGSIVSAVTGSDYTQKLLEESSSIQWELGDVMQSDHKATVTVCFSYEELFSGSVGIDMISEDGEWKISGIDMPKFD